MMSRFKNYSPRGVIPATLLAFNDDYSINDKETTRHLRHVASVPGLNAITVNGHASEVHACTVEEQQRILSVSMAEAGDKIPLINGVYADGTLEAVRIAKMAEQEGASCLLVFPPNSMSMGGQLRPEMAQVHYKMLADATDLPMILFQYPMSTGLGYPFETMMRLIEDVPTIRAIKDWCANPMLHEKHIRTLQGLSRPVTVLTTHSAWLMASLSMGADGLLSGAGSVVAAQQVALFNAIKSGDLTLARSINDQLYPMQQAFYAEPFLDMHNRMKECLVMQGLLDRAVVRPPLMKLRDTELASLRRALESAGLLKDRIAAE